MGHLIFNTDVEPPTVTIFNDENLAKVHTIALIKEQDKKHDLGIDFLDQIGGYSLPDLDDIVPGVLVMEDEEKSDGYFIGFSSSDRANFVGTLPIEEDDWLGNGDVYVFKTKGKAPGTYTPDEKR